MTSILGVFGGIVKIFAALILSLLSILPDSPFGGLLAQINQFDFLGYINWFIPFDFCLVCLNAWIACVTVYYYFDYIKAVLMPIVKKFLTL